MNKYFVLGALAVVFIVLFGWTSTVVVKATSAPEVLLPVRGYDPRDLLSGHYISYQIDWDKANCAQFVRGRCPVSDFGPSGRFYVPEDKAHALDDVFRFGASTDELAIVFAYKPGQKPIARRLLINGQEWQDVLK